MNSPQGADIRVLLLKRKVYNSAQNPATRT